MKNFRKIAAVALVIALVMSFAGCASAPVSLKPEWSYKTDTAEYPIGVYVYSLFSAYNQAYSVISEAKGEDFDQEASILSVESTFDETGETFVCSDWIVAEADKITKNLIAIDQAVEEYGIELDEALVDAAYEQARSDWYLGAYYEEYASYGYAATPYRDMLEPYGVSFDSFYQSSYLASVKQNALFEHFYAKGGIKEVSEAKMKEYFEDNYTSYSYFSANLYETAIDETSGESVNKAFSDEQVYAIKDNLEMYTRMIDKGTSFEDISRAYTAYAQLENNPAISNIENLETSSLGAEVVEALRGLKEGKATVVTVGEADTAVAYLVCKHPIAKETKDYMANETNYDALLQGMKSEEFLQYVEGLTDTAQCEQNTEVVAKYDPAIFEDNL